MKKFNYKHYKNCYFNVASYAYNKNAMAIEIENIIDQEKLKEYTKSWNYGK